MPSWLFPVLSLVLTAAGWIYFFAFWRGKVDTTLSHQQHRDRDIEEALNRRGQRSDLLSDRVQVLIGRVDQLPSSLRPHFLDRDTGFEAIRASVEDRLRLHEEDRRITDRINEMDVEIASITARLEERRRSPK